MRWQKVEIDFLKQNYQILSKQQIALKLDKKIKSVQAQMTRFGLLAGKRWKPEEDDIIRLNYGRIEPNDLSKLLPRWSYKSIKSRACTINVTKSRKIWTKTELNLLQNNYINTTIPDLVLLFDNKFSKAEIFNKSKKLGLSKPDLRWTNIENEYLKLNYLVAKKSEILENIPDRTWDSIKGQANKLKIGNRRTSGVIRKYYADFDYFEKIDTEEKAYWLGFIFADGSVSREGSLRITLVVEGKEHLEKFKKAIKYTGDVKGPYHVTSKHKGGEKTKYTVEIRNKKMCADLAVLGVIPNKTFFVKFPEISKELRKHFIRGLFDGDGCVMKKTTKYKDKVYETPGFSICGAVPKFLEDIVDVFAEEVGVKKNKVLRSIIKNPLTPKQQYSAWKFIYEGTPALRIRDWMYDGATTWMDCKRNKFYSYDYSMNRPQDKQNQETIIDKLTDKCGYKRLSDYIGYYDKMTFQCDQGHVYTTSVHMFKLGRRCSKCCAEQIGERNVIKGKRNLANIFAQRRWKLISEYSSEGYIQIECEHGKQFTLKRTTATQAHAKCDCLRKNDIQAGKKSLVSRLERKGWKLISEYKGMKEYVTIECQHGKQFKRLANNIRDMNQYKCDCEKIGKSGLKHIYLQPSGRWTVVMYRKTIGIFNTKEEAILARDNYKETSH